MRRYCEHGNIICMVCSSISYNKDSNTINTSDLMERINILEKKVDKINSLTDTIRNSYNAMCETNLAKKPHKCPLCDVDILTRHKW
jgi:hypothetical protein